MRLISLILMLLLTSCVPIRRCFSMRGLEVPEQVLYKEIRPLDHGSWVEVKISLDSKNFRCGRYPVYFTQYELQDTEIDCSYYESVKCNASN